MTTYERIGGEAIAQAALDDFFQRAQTDALLAHLIGPAVPAGAHAFATAALDLDNHAEALRDAALGVWPEDEDDNEEDEAAA